MQAIEESWLGISEFSNERFLFGFVDFNTDNSFIFGSYALLVAVFPVPCQLCKLMKLAAGYFRVQVRAFSCPIKLVVSLIELLALE